jgi:hypothetical protein
MEFDVVSEEELISTEKTGSYSFLARLMFLFMPRRTVIKLQHINIANQYQYKPCSRVEKTEGPSKYYTFIFCMIVNFKVVKNLFRKQKNLTGGRVVADER